ncbi:hypothetical protein RCL_jg25098.t1 [Rhizophagus clarus]|uniref:Uncharacterized protein n=1 Tax=Rhizophagus clarus TaxID=94130 RepID=A0A8H3QTB5_9GLOM|nr:hypothetical protein RCL_jg25098.t1 [Rhizophagus clarus]
MIRCYVIIASEGPNKLLSEHKAVLSCVSPQSFKTVMIIFRQLLPSSINIQIKLSRLAHRQYFDAEEEENKEIILREC